jgi:DNA modification methylase
MCQVNYCHKKGRIIAGNKTVENAGAIGMEDVTVVQTDGKRIIAVQRTDLDLEADPMARELAIADNRAGDLNLAWDPDVLKDLVGDIDLSPFFTDKELKELGALAGDTPEAPDAKIDQAEELLKVWKVERDQIWSIPSKSATGGAHRIMCGDSTAEVDIVALMAGQRAHMVFTDPPYGVDYDGGAKKRDKLEGDHPGTEIYANSLIHLRDAADDEASLYLWYADAHAAAAAAAAAGYQIVAQIIWAKNHAQFVSSAHYHGKHEPCFFAHRKGKTARWFGPKNEVTLWEYDRAPSNDFHPTQKPPVLAVRAINNSTEVGHIVLDLFLGSASTMCAAEQTGRLCYGMEIEPKYVAVALQRMADMGLKPELVTERCAIAVPA